MYHNNNVQQAKACITGTINMYLDNIRYIRYYL